ncbi:hypothetical protein ARMGADRAFT_573846 [Armillaria gallica]|uniref:Uncharacterized protein n=1 Tax=Armillaria gallica TaxID=47427 RepID=A0A2H3DSX7_ARMGA|nr:hypothetical protein ARMGADRAFT_573846 [Armillaria gallica]
MYEILILMYWTGSNYTECNVDLDSACAVCRCIELPKTRVYGCFSSLSCTCIDVYTIPDTCLCSTVDPARPRLPNA